MKPCPLRRSEGLPINLDFGLTRSAGCAGNVLMFDQGVVPVTLPNVPQEVLIRTPILKMIRQQPALVEG